MGKKKVDNGQVTAGHRFVERGRAHCVWGIQHTLGGDQGRRDLKVAIAGGLMQRRRSVVIGGVGIGAGREQEMGKLNLPPRGHVMQGGPPHFVGGCDIR